MEGIVVFCRTVHIESGHTIKGRRGEGKAVSRDLTYCMCRTGEGRYVLQHPAQFVLFIAGRN